MAALVTNLHLEKKIESSKSLNFNKRLKLDSMAAKTIEPCNPQVSNFQQASARNLSNQSSLIETLCNPPGSRSNINKQPKNGNPLGDPKQPTACQISDNSKQNVGIEQLPISSSGDQKLSWQHSHPKTQCMITNPVYDHWQFNSNIISATHHLTTNPEQNQTFIYTGQCFEQRFMDPNVAGTTDAIISSQCSTVYSSSNKNNTNGTQLFLPVYNPINLHQPQVPAPINIPTRWFGTPIPQRMPATSQSLFPSIWFNSNQNFQPPRTTIPNLLGILKPPPVTTQCKFNLTPEIPGQIFTLPIFCIGNSATNTVHEQNTADSKLGRSKMLRKFKQFAKRSDYSKKNLLKVEIPVELPTKSLFPSYLTPPGGIVLRPLQQTAIQFPTPSSCVPTPSSCESTFVSEPEIISKQPSHLRGFTHKPIPDPLSYRSPIVFNQATTQPSAANMYQFGTHLGIPSYQTIQSGSHLCNQMQSGIQTEIVMLPMRHF